MNVKIRELVMFIFLVTTQGIFVQGCRSDAFPSVNHFLLGEDIHYLAPNTTHRFGHLVLVPEMKFSCHGRIKGWSALVQFESNEQAINNLYHDITFQLWRPSPTQNDVYSFVGSQTIAFVGQRIRDGLTTRDGIQYLNFTSVEPGDQEEKLVFQPGDVIGWYIHTLFQSIDHPLSIVYRGRSASDPTLRPVDMYTKLIADTAKAATNPPCRVSLCNDELTVIPSVIPYVTVDIDTSSSSSSTQPGGTGRCINTTLNFDSCNSSPITKGTILHTTNPPSKSTGTPPIELPAENGSSSPSIALTIGIVTSLVVIAVLFNIVVTFLIVYIRSKRLKGQSSRVKTDQDDKLEEESRYSTHSDSKPELSAMTSEAYTTDIRTKRNEAYGASSVATTSGTSVVRYYV